MSSPNTSKLILEGEAKNFDKWFKSMHEYKEEMRRRYLDELKS